MEGETSTDKKTILIVDDEQPIIDMLVYNLEKEGYNTLEATDGEKAVDIALNNTPDLILLDIMIPKMDGLSVCKRIRHTLNVPIIMLSAKGEEIDKILGLELGADDYITKPFSIRELMARIKANLRKGKGSYEDGKLEANTNKIIVGDLQLDVDKFETRVKNKVIDLTLREFEVLKYLANQLGQVVTRETLLEKVWGYEYYGDIRTVDVTVRRIREKIEEEYNELMKLIAHLREILGSEKLVFEIIKEELTEVKEKYGDERLTKIVAAEGEFNEEDLIKEATIKILGKL